MQVSQPSKSNMSHQTIFFALEDIRDAYGGPIRSVECLSELFIKAGYKVIILQANFKFRPQSSRFNKYSSIYTFWDFLFYLISFKLDRNSVVFNNQWTPLCKYLVIAVYIQIQVYLVGQRCYFNRFSKGSVLFGF